MELADLASELPRQTPGAACNRNPLDPIGNAVSYWSIAQSIYHRPIQNNAFHSRQYHRRATDAYLFT